MSARVCFAAMESFAGCIASCRNAATLLQGEWAAIPREGDFPAVVMEAGLVVLSSWHKRYEVLLDRRSGPIVPRVHAMVMETDLADETGPFSRMVALLDTGRLPALAVSDREYLRLLRRDRVVYLPDLLDETQYRATSPVCLAGVNVSLFCAPHWRKNLVAQAAAFDRARCDTGAVRWTLHLNGQTSSDAAYGLWLETLRIPFVDHGRLERPRYLAMVAGMDAGLCAGIRESYCYVAADHVALGVPVVVSAGVTCLDGLPDRPSPHDVVAMAQRLSEAIDDPRAVHARQRDVLTRGAQEHLEHARAAIEQLLVYARA